MKRVLVPLDGSPHAEDALETAFEIFPEARIEVLHVIQVASVTRNDAESAMERAERRADEILSAAEEIADDHGREIETEAIEGHAAKTIVSYAEDNDIDHIVMGSVGRSGVRRLMLGSVADSVTRRAPCDVTVTRRE
jgi:nucleotide-binding universal stress UspA family protein